MDYLNAFRALSQAQRELGPITLYPPMTCARVMEISVPLLRLCLLVSTPRGMDGYQGTITVSEAFSFWPLESYFSSHFHSF